MASTDPPIGKHQFWCRDPAVEGMGLDILSVGHEKGQQLYPINRYHVICPQILVPAIDWGLRQEIWKFSQIQTETLPNFEAGTSLSPFCIIGGEMMDDDGHEGLEALREALERARAVRDCAVVKDMKEFHEGLVLGLELALELTGRTRAEKVHQ